MTKLYLSALLFGALPALSSSLNIVIAGGTGSVGRYLSSTLDNEGHKVTILSRNAFLASAPARVSTDFGWLGSSFLEENESVKLRDWDGGDLTDIVGCDWMGWQEDTLKNADCIINLVGGYTEQRVMACERIIRESLRCNTTAKQILLSLEDVDLVTTLKKNRAKKCEDMLLANCAGSVCLRGELNDMENTCSKIMDAIKEV